MSSVDAVLKSARQAYGGGDLARANNLFATLTRTAPELVEPWISLAYIELQQGGADAALGMAQTAVRLDPENPFANLLLCRALVANMKLADALAVTQKALSLKTCPPAALDGFGLVVLQMGRYVEARELFRRAVDGGAANPTVLYNLAFTEHACGAMAEAERLLDRVIALRPDFHTAYFLRSDLRKQTHANNHVAAMEAAITSGLRDPRGEIAIRFALGKECEDLGDYSKAIGHLKVGAVLQRRSFRYDVSLDIGFIDRMIAAFDAGAMERLSARLDDDAYCEEAPIFIVGLPRSGTTLVERLVGAHTHVVAAGELGLMPLELGKAAQRAGSLRQGEWIERLSQIDWARLGRDYVRLAREPGLPPDKRFIDKNPTNFLLCGAIASALPNAKIIAMRRNPMDSCFAAYKTLFSGPAHPWSYDLRETSDYYAAFDRLIAHWRSQLKAKTFLEVRYEDVITNPEGQTRRILEFLDLPWQDQVLRFHESDAPTATASAAQVRRPVYASSVGNWRHFAGDLGEVRERLALQVAQYDSGGV
jgi:tetratricopeptide (TPR) repeat protein